MTIKDQSFLRDFLLDAAIVLAASIGLWFWMRGLS